LNIDRSPYGLRRASDDRAAGPPRQAEQSQGQPTFSLLFLIGCGSALAGVTLAALPSREPLTAASPA
jgi:hypothetical protein